jgi:hypothetical protein
VTKKNIYILLLGIALITIVYVYFSPTRVYKEMNGLIYSIDSDFNKKTQIVVSGEIIRRLFANDVFVGEITIDNDISHRVELNYEGGKFFSPIVTEDENALLTTIGTVMATKKFDYIWLTLRDIDDKYGIHEGYIFSPANTKEEANERIKRVLMK